MGPKINTNLKSTSKNLTGRQFVTNNVNNSSNTKATSITNAGVTNTVLGNRNMGGDYTFAKGDVNAPGGYRAFTNQLMNLHDSSTTNVYKTSKVNTVNIN